MSERTGLEGWPAQVALANHRYGERPHDTECRFPVRLVDLEKDRARFNFEPMSLEQEERLVSIIFGRADCWLNWRVNRKEDKPLLSFLVITGVALQGIAAIPLALVDLMRRSQQVQPETTMKNPVQEIAN